VPLDEACEGGRRHIGEKGAGAQNQRDAESDPERRPDRPLVRPFESQTDADRSHDSGGDSVRGREQRRAARAEDVQRERSKARRQHACDAGREDDRDVSGAHGASLGRRLPADPSCPCPDIPLPVEQAWLTARRGAGLR
jgi:hypothetical protein